MGILCKKKGNFCKQNKFLFIQKGNFCKQFFFKTMSLKSNELLFSTEKRLETPPLQKSFVLGAFYKNEENCQHLYYGVK